MAQQFLIRVYNKQQNLKRGGWGITKRLRNIFKQCMAMGKPVKIPETLYKRRCLFLCFPLKM